MKTEQAVGREGAAADDPQAIPANRAGQRPISAPAPDEAGTGTSERRRGSLSARIILGIAATTIVLLAAYVGLSMVVADRLTRPERRELASSPEVFGLTYEEVVFPSVDDGLLLHGWFLPAAGSDRVVVIIHGRNSSRTGNDGDLVAQAAALVRAGYNVLAFDFRAHGESAGPRYTMGWHERSDVLGAVAYLKARGFTPERMGFWSHSMGAATMLLTAAASPDVRAIVADSSFARLDDLLAKELPKNSGLPGFFNPTILFFGKVLYGMDTAVLNPVDAVSKLPPESLFIIHAKTDQLIPVEHAHRLATAAGPALYDLWVFPGGSHDRMLFAVPDQYRARVLAFFDRQLRAVS